MPKTWDGDRRVLGGSAGAVPESRQTDSPVRLVAVVGALLCVLALPGTSVTAPGATVDIEHRRPERRNAEHRYRIVGKVRLLFVWASADDVGGARVTWRSGEQNQSVALLIGSEPRRAPRGVNAWGYIREDVSPDSTKVFGIRTVTDGDSPEEAEARRRARERVVELGVLCAKVSRVDAASRTATVYVPGEATYRDLDRVLDVVERHGAWNGRRTARPANVAPGFLTALDLMMRISARQANDTPACPRLSYVYKDAVYDLIPRRVERIAALRTESGVYENLLRTDMAVKNRATGSITGFSITYGTEGPLAGVPVAAKYQPNWWFKVELELDEGQDVPPDPAADVSVNQRIAQLCLRNAE